jgi:hypothetical protein
VSVTGCLGGGQGQRNIPADPTIIDSPYREVVTPLIDYIRAIQRDSPRDVVCVYIPEYVVNRWWEHLLHNQSALRLKARLLFTPGVMVTNVPYQLAGSHHPVIGDRLPAGLGDPRRRGTSAADTLSDL